MVTQRSRNVTHNEKESGSHKKHRQEVQFHFNVYFSRQNHPELQLGRVLKPWWSAPCCQNKNIRNFGFDDQGFMKSMLLAENELSEKGKTKLIRLDKITYALLSKHEH